MTKTVRLKDWATGPNGFDYPQSQERLNHLAKTGQISPPARKDGKIWVVDEDSVFIGRVGKLEISKNLQPEVRALVEKVKNGRTEKT